MIFQILFILLIILTSITKLGAASYHEVVYNKNEIITDDIVRKGTYPVNRIVMAQNVNYIDLAQYLILREEDRMPNAERVTSNSINKIEKKSTSEGLVVNQDFFYKNGVYMVKSNWATMRGVVREDWYDVGNGYASVCKKIQSQSDAMPVKSAFVQIGNIGNLKTICNELDGVKNNNESDIASYFVNNFTPYMIGDDELNQTYGTFTGYYYPMLNASRERTGKYRYPIYKKPKECNANAPCYSREEIENGALDGKGLEIFWVDDYVDLFFLHIQGSGVLNLREGGQAHVKFSAKNNQQYASIGKYMTEKKYIKRGDDAREFLRHNPRVANEIMNVNKSYIFFEENHDKSVVGAHGSELVDGRSLAVDNKFIPYGLMLYLDTNGISQVMFAQDTGSAIKGKIRGDIFVGKGFDAGEKAKKIYNNGYLYVIVHKNQKIEVI
jgi:membrane-bound lytic murein transglycosylase A